MSDEARSGRITGWLKVMVTLFLLASLSAIGRDNNDARTEPGDGTAPARQNSVTRMPDQSARRVPRQRATHTYCGIRRGTAGNAILVDRRNQEVLELARQGESSHLLDKADRLVGRNGSRETGTQNGQRYCITVKLDHAGNPIKVVAARLDVPFRRLRRDRE